MRQKIAPIDGGKNDIRLIVSEDGWLDDDGLVGGESIEPPDGSGGWQLVDFWVEYDEEQATEERVVDGKKVKVITTRKVKPQLHALWVKPKAVVKKARTKKSGAAPVVLKADGDVKVPNAEPKKKRGRSRKTPAATETPPNGEGEAPGVASYEVGDFAVVKKLLEKCCEHTRQMLSDTIHLGEKRAITLEDVKAYEPLCHECQKAAKVLDTATGGE